MRIFVVENCDIQKLKLYIIAFNKKFDADEKKIVIVNANNVDEFAMEGEDIGGDEIHYFDMLMDREGIKGLFRMKKKGTVYVNIFGCEEELKDEFIECLQQYRNYFEEYIQNLILICNSGEISNMAIQLERALFVHQTEWTEKEFKDYIKRQKKEVFRFKYVYNRKYVFDLFLVFGKIKRKLGLIK